MKRIVAYIIALALFAAAFAGCSAPVDEPAPTVEPSNEPTETVEPSAEPVADNTQALENAAAYIKLMYKKSAVKTPADYKGAHKTVILKITIMASVRQGWQRNNGYLVKAGCPLFFCCHEKQ